MRPSSASERLQPSPTPMARHPPRLTMAQHPGNGFFAAPAPTADSKAGVAAGTTTTDPTTTTEDPRVSHRALQPRRLERAADGSGRPNCSNVHKSKLLKKSFSKTYLNSNRGAGMGKERATSASHSSQFPKNGTPSPIHTQLGKDNNRPMGIRPTIRTHPRAIINAHAGWGSQRIPYIPGAGPQARSRDPSSSGEGSGINRSPPTGRGIHLKDVCGPKKGWQCETHNRAEGTEQVHTLGTLQDGRNPSGERSTAGGRLDGQDRPQGCLFLHPHRSSQTDNRSAMTYVNKRGGTHSASLTQLAKTVWLWCMERKISLVAEHIPGLMNTVADEESRRQADRWDWKLCPAIFQRINLIWGTTNQLERFFSWRLDPLAAGRDAFHQQWVGRTFANAPWILIPRVLSEVRVQQATIILVAPVWYLVLLSLLIDHPRLIPAQETNILQVHQAPLPIRGQEVQLAAWPISGDPASQASYQRRLQSFSWPPSDPNHSPPTIHSFTSGSAGVLHGAEIPFMDLWEI